MAQIVLTAKCRKCQHVWTRDTTTDAWSIAGYQDRCPACHNWTMTRQVVGKVGTRECGDWCTSGTGRACTCTCGAQNHGQAWRIK